MSIQFNQLITKKGMNNVFGDLLDNATQNEILDMFYYRYLCDDDDKFIKFFQRTIRRYKRQYAQYLRIETTEFDPMVTRYLERKYTDVYAREDHGTETNTNTNSSTYDTTSNVENTETRNLTDTSNSTRTDNLTSVTGTDRTTSETGHTQNVFSDMPQANVSSSTTQGDLTDVNFEYATNMTKAGTQATGTSEEDTTTTNTGTVGNIGTDTSTGTVVNDGDSTSHYAGTTNINKEATKTNNTETNSIHKEVYSGRENSSPQQMLDMARDYILRTNAFNWLVNKLDVCFMGDLLYGEDE